MKPNSILIFVALFFLTNSCDGQNRKPEKSQSKTNKTEKMNSVENLNFEKQITILKNSMIEYMGNASPKYSKNDVEECVQILNNYVTQISTSKSKDQGMEIVKNAVEKLNNLNEKCDFELIETSEREQIAEIIILASSKKGYNKPEEDITENWREW